MFHVRSLINKNQCIMKKCQVFVETAFNLSIKVNKWLINNDVNIINIVQSSEAGMIVLTIIYEEKNDLK